MQHNNPEPGNNHVRNSMLRWVLVCCGWLFVVAGTAGLFVPLLPTVPFLLLAAACFARSSELFHTWLVEHNYLGPLIRDYLNGGGIPLKAKRTAIVMLWLSCSISYFAFAQTAWVRLLLVVIAVAVSLYLLFLPTRQTGCDSADAAG